MILDNGVIRTLDPSLPTCGALAIAGPIVAGGVGTHEWALPTPERVDLAGRCVLPAFTDSHVHFPTWSLARHDVQLEGAARSRPRSRSSAATPAVAPGSGAPAGATRPGREAARRPTAARRGHRRHPGRAVVEGLPLALAQLRRPRARRREPRRAGRGRRARRRREADGDPARGVGLALPRPLRDGDRGRVGRRDARGHPRRERRGVAAIHDKDGWLGAASIFGRIHEQRRAVAARLAVAARRPAARELAALAAALADRRRLPPARLPEDVHGRDARLADGTDARRLRRPDHERRGARGGDPRAAAARRLARRGARDRRPGEPGRARCLRGDAGRPGGRSASASGSSTRSASIPRICPASPSSGRLLGAVLPRARRTATSRSGSGATGSTAPTRSAACSTRAPSSPTAPTRRSRSSTRSPGSAPACCGRSTTARPWRPEEALTIEQAIVASTVTPAWLAGDERRRGRLLPGFLADLVRALARPVHLPARRARLGRGRVDDGRRHVGLPTRRPGIERPVGSLASGTAMLRVVATRTMLQVHQSETCSVAACAEIVGAKWTVLIVHELSEGRTPLHADRALVRRHQPAHARRAAPLARGRGDRRPPQLRRVAAAGRVRADRQGRGAAAPHRRDAPVRPRMARLRRPRPLAPRCADR